MHLKVIIGELAFSIPYMGSRSPDEKITDLDKSEVVGGILLVANM